MVATYKIKEKENHGSMERIHERSTNVLYRVIQKKRGRLKTKDGDIRQLKQGTWLSKFSLDLIKSSNQLDK